MLSRTTTAASLIAALALLSGCSGDDSDAAEKSPSVNPTVEARTECEAEVELTGKIEKSWSGEAFVITENRSGPVLYRSTQGKLTLTVFGADGDFDALGSLSAGKESYTTQGGDFEVDNDGGGAEVDADAQGNNSGKTVHITASFDC